ncbi:MAG TPA: hypothetical protein VKA49_21035 [Flavitalea sp.]|nr:hypothetical protein [Flavitalea sp.]
MKYLKFSAITMVFAFAFFIGCKRDAALVQQPDEALGVAPKAKMDVPVVTCAEGSTQVSINLQVCAGTTGAPAGFSIQWMTKAAFVANGDVWLASDDLALCKGSFSGNANLSRYNLAPGECVTVNVGEFLLDEGASTNCDGALVCGTDYVFRAFAHANSSLMRSDFTANTGCGTLACEGGEGCTFTQGYWKTHGPIPTGNNTNEWDVQSLTLGTVLYTDLQLQSIFDTPTSGNVLISLAHQLIAAKLNIANGSDPSAIAATIAAADALIGDLVVPPVGGGFLNPFITPPHLTIALMSYNEGLIGPGHCN